MSGYSYAAGGYGRHDPSRRLPYLPKGFVFLVDDDGFYLRDDDGAYLMESIQ